MKKELSVEFLRENMMGPNSVRIDLWITATENYARFRELGLDGRIVPIHADALSLPYAEGFFDGIVSVDSYHYFGTGEGFASQNLAPLSRVVESAVDEGGFHRDHP